LQRPTEYDGHRFTVSCLTLSDGSCPSAEFLADLTKDERRKFDVLFERLGDHGRISNSEHFKKLEGTDGLWEFKRHQLRLFCFYGPNRTVYLLYGLRKKKDKHSATDVRRAEQYKKDFDQREA
jgi:phage-related protein